MPISRMDLADAGSPEALVKRILQAEPNLPVPVPIHKLCARLGIFRVEEFDNVEFQGGLVSDAKRSEDTIAHELGHFLMAHHIPDQPGLFMCESSNLLCLTLNKCKLQLAAY